MKSKPKTTTKDPNVYPPGWDRRRVQAIIDYYDARKDQDVFSEIETERVTAGLVWIEVPQELIPEVRKLIARRKKSA